MKRILVFAQLGLDPNTTSLLATGIYGIVNSEDVSQLSSPPGTG
jgi:hypothetical protein